jgi:hypothetical protein
MPSRARRSVLSRFLGPPKDELTRQRHWRGDEASVPEHAAAISYTRALLTAAKALYNPCMAVGARPYAGKTSPVYAISLAGVPHSDRRRAQLDNRRTLLARCQSLETR